MRVLLVVVLTGCTRLLDIHDLPTDAPSADAAPDGGAPDTGPRACPRDTFAGATLDPQWSLVGASAELTARPAGGELLFELKKPMGSTAIFIDSVDAHDFTVGDASLAVVEPAASPWLVGLYLHAQASQEGYAVLVGDDLITCALITMSTNRNTQIAYDPHEMRYLRLRHEEATNTVECQTSAAGSTWQPAGSVPADLALTNLRVAVVASLSSSATTDTRARVDDVDSHGADCR